MCRFKVIIALCYELVGVVYHDLTVIYYGKVCFMFVLYCNLVYDSHYYPMSTCLGNATPMFPSFYRPVTKAKAAFSPYPHVAGCVVTAKCH